MVKHSLWKMLDKYPYFLDKRRVSNLYKVTKVNNSVFRDLYNSLFHTYQSFHLNKRLLIWRTQNAPYVYQTHFCCSYNNIKLVQIYKNDVLIHQDEYTEDEEKTDYCWTYECSYVKTNMLPIKVYRCVICDSIYFGDELPNDCVGEGCNSNTYIQTRIFQCNNCDEYYFADSINDLEIKSHTEGYEVITGYRCTNCGELYETIPESCSYNCNKPNYEQITLYKCNICGKLHKQPPVENPEILNNEYYTENYAFECMGNHTNEGINEFEVSVEGLGRDIVENDCGELYIGTEPPEVCKICGASGLAEVRDLYYNDETLMVLDNSTDYQDVIEVSSDMDVELNHINDSLLVNSDKKLFVKIIDSADNILNNATVRLYSYQNYTELKTNSEGIAQFPLDITKKYTHITVQKNGFVSRYGESTSKYSINWNYITENYLMTVKLYDIKVYNKLNIYDEEDDFNIRTTGLDDVISNTDNFRIPFPVIPDDKFLFHVETWDEFWTTKGYPENDSYMNDYYDHDYSLDEIGELNNIPRKRYVDVNDIGLYPSTEPPFNKYLTEDDYHYMKRMIEYNLRLFIYLIKLDKKDSNYLNYINFLNNVGIDEEKYDIYTMDSRSFKEDYNPVTLELWKTYSIPSKLVNREKYLLKLFDLRKHNQSYLPYEVDAEGNPIKIYNQWELDKNNNPYNKWELDKNNNTINEGIGRYVYKDKWDVVTDLAECWYPKPWEHMDRFCDGSKLYKTYFFVQPETLRPLPYESVYCEFNLINSIGVPVTENYYVYLEYYRDSEEDIKPVNNRYITEGHCTIKYTMFSTIKPTTIRFTAYYIDYDDEYNPYNMVEDNLIGSVDITFSPRNSCNADIYVDVNSTQSKEDGSKNYPYKSLQTALNKVNRNMDLICLMSNINITAPFFVPNSCRILGVRERDKNTTCAIEKNVKNVPVIRNDVSRKFFNLIGNKNCTLKLVDIRLAHKTLNSYIGISTWNNTNRLLNDYETVIIHGGVAIIKVVLNKNEYFPSDIVKVTIYITDKHGNPIKYQKIDLVFDNGEVISLEDTDGDGIITYNLFTGKKEIGIYDLKTTLKSDLYFNSTVITKVNCTKEPHLYISDGDAVEITSPYDTPNSNITVCVDGGDYIDHITSDSDGGITYEYTPTDWNSHVILFIDDDYNVIDMILVEVKVSISQLVGQKFIKNLTINTAGDITYDEIVIKATSTLSDFNKAIVDLKVNGRNIEITEFNVKSNRSDATELYSEEGLILKDAITKIECLNNLDIRFTRIGEFWRN